MVWQHLPFCRFTVEFSAESYLALWLCSFHLSCPWNVLGLAMGVSQRGDLLRSKWSWWYFKSLQNRELRSYPQVSKHILVLPFGTRNWIWMAIAIWMMEPPRIPKIYKWLMTLLEWDHNIGGASNLMPKCMGNLRGIVNGCGRESLKESQGINRKPIQVIK